MQSGWLCKALSKVSQPKLTFRNSLKQCTFQFHFRDHAKQQILKILENISYLKPPEKLLLYLRLPGGYPETGKNHITFFYLFAPKVVAPHSAPIKTGCSALPQFSG
jgi:hypothetical protein